jgi:hypothetical protein
VPKKHSLLLTLLCIACSVIGQAKKDTTALSEIKITASPIVTRLQEYGIYCTEKSDIQKMMA